MTKKVPVRKSARKKANTPRAKKPPVRTVKKPVLAYDLGGTKVAVGIVNDRGHVLEEIRQPVVIEKGKDAVIQQLADIGLQLMKRYPGVKRAGIASAGPLDPMKGLLLDPTNFTSAEGSWGATPLASLLSRKLKIPVTLDNDAAAAMLAEAWIGRAKGYRNAMILTLGTGLGTGIIANGELVRAGHFFHPEAGHTIIRAGDRSAPCGCGNLGCAEAYLSGRNFGRRAAIRLGDPNLDAREVTELARRGDRRALEMFAEYAELMAVAIHNYVVCYCPEIVVLTGSFAAASDMFIEATEQHLLKMLARRRVGVDLVPELAVSSLENEAGLIGGAYLALRAEA
jgi:glucokinase